MIAQEVSIAPINPDLVVGRPLSSFAASLAARCASGGGGGERMVPLHGEFFRAYSNSRITVELLGNYCRITVELLHNLNYCRITVELLDWTLYRCTNSFSPL